MSINQFKSKANAHLNFSIANHSNFQKVLNSSIQQRSTAIDVSGNLQQPSLPGAPRRPALHCYDFAFDTVRCGL